MTTQPDSSSPSTVRRATLADVPLVAPLLDAYRMFYGQPGDLDAARTFLAQRLAREESVVFLAELDAAPAGFTQLYPLFSSVGLRRIWLLNDLFVAPGARRRGVSTALLDAARQHGLDTGAARLTLQTAVTNHAAQASYAAHGWQRDDAFLTYILPLK